MKILLLQPEDTRSSILKLPFRPLTLELLAAYLDGHEVDIFDMRVDPTPLAEKLAAFEPRLVGITCPFSMTVPTVTRLITQVKALRPQACVVVGGVHPSLLPHDFDAAGPDAIVNGAGEHVLPEVAAALEQGHALSEVKGLHVREGGTFRSTGAAAQPYDLKNFRVPARQLTQKYVDRYPRSFKGQRTALTVATRGCPYRCNFCAAWKVQGGKYLMREVDNLYAELETIDDELVYFFDDNAFGNAARMKELALRITGRGLKKEFQMWASADAIASHEDLIEAWAAAGLQRLFVGFESCDDAQLRGYNKRATVAVNERAFELLAKHKVDLSPTFIVRPDFTEADFARLEAYLVGHRFLMPYVLIYTPLPGTGLWDQHQAELITRDHEHFDLMHLTLEPTHLSRSAFMARFTALYLENPTWQAVARKVPVAREMLDNLVGLRAMYA